MLGLKVQLPLAEHWKKKLLDEGFFATNYRIQKEGDYIYYPITARFPLKDTRVQIVEMDFLELRRKKTLKENLTAHLSSEELHIVKTAHDVIGSIAIIEIPKDIEPHEHMIAQTLLESNPQIKTVLKKAAIHDGTFRTQKMTYLAGVDTKESIYKENGVRLTLNVEEVYFSVRLSTERKRIAEQVGHGEEILVMFSGAAPYPVVLSKQTSAKSILGIEINPAGHRYGEENVRLNKCKNVSLICGDVHTVIPQLLKENPGLRFDRIVMPLPKTADEFLTDALSVAKQGTFIHFYDFLPESDFDEAKKKIAEACTHAGVSYRILRVVKCGQHAPHVFRICVDFILL